MFKTRGSIALNEEKIEGLPAMKFFVYILRCADGTFYTGWTTDVQRRLAAHNKGRGAKYTRGRLPTKLFWFSEYNSKSEAMKVECAIKRLSRNEKSKCGSRNKQV
jgi:putative endonuclease